MKGIPGNITTENLMDAPITAHIMGGCTIGQDPDKGVIDEEYLRKESRHKPL